MVRIVLALYDFFERRTVVFWSVFIGITLLLSAGASQIRIEEDITKFFPDDKKTAELNYVFKNSKFAEQLVVMVSMKDSTAEPQPDSLIAKTESVVAAIDSTLKPYIKSIRSQIDDEKILEIFNSLYENLPVFLTEEDYVHLDSVLTRNRIRETLGQNYNQLISPVGMAFKKIIVKDPLGFSFLPLKRLRGVQYDENFELYDGYVITRDHRHILFFITPTYPPGDTGNNTKFIAALQHLLNVASGPTILVSVFGASAVAVGNAVQLRQDTYLTMGLMVVLLGIFLVGFFRRKRVPFLISIPVLFGALFSLCCIWLIKGSVSILALAAGSVVLGIAVNYALHFLAHLKHVRNTRETIADLVGPMTLGSATTVLAFFCLQFTNAAVLRDVGLFAGFSLIGAAICSLIFLPHFTRENLFVKGNDGENIVERIPFEKLASKKLLIALILIATPVFFYFAGRVTFDSDVSSLNYMSDETRESQARLERLNNSAQTTIFVVSRQKDLEHALRKNEQAMPVFEKMKTAGTIRKYSSVSTFLISDSLQQARISRWNSFWSPEKKKITEDIVRQEGALLKFSPQVLDNYATLVSKKYNVADTSTLNAIRSAFFDNYIIEKDTTVTVISLVNVDPRKKVEAYQALRHAPTEAFDRQMLANMFIRYVNADFNFIVMFTAILVFVSLLISYGRIELTLITFAPMFITWIWILGIMAIVGIQFNIVNVMVSTFIFGLGDDYSIFIMDGLQREYQTGRKNLPSIRTSIFLSAVTTITGLGVLFFAHHPAMRSIAAISIIGILCVFVMSQTIEPWLFRLLITDRTKRGLPPRTMAGMFGTFLTYGTFIAGSFILTMIGLILRAVPFAKKQLKYFYHSLLSPTARLVIYLEPNVRKVFVGRTHETLRKPAILIANHSTVMDILLTIMLQPKVILVTNQWVWNSPVFGAVARLADYFTVAEGVDNSFERFKPLVEEGYTIVIFPEGTRSDDGTIKRFHKGAFYLAEQLNLPIQPFLIHGASYSSPKGTFYLSPGQFTMKFLPLIQPGDTRFGIGYSERTKRISRYFKKEFDDLSTAYETPEYFSNRVISNYIYKGPVLEWYMRIKLKLEKNYSFFFYQLPRTGAILDIGCGYGFFCQMLHLRSPQQPITGIDYDAEKIATAQHSYLTTETLHFECADAMVVDLKSYSGIVISDVLHYLKPDDQWSLLQRCCSALLPGGMLIIQDGNSESKEKHGMTKLTEFFSVNVLRFNKAENPLNFMAADDIVRFAVSQGLEAEVVPSSQWTSNVLIVIRRS